jgi:hypothetical protein
LILGDEAGERRDSVKRGNTQVIPEHLWEEWMFRNRPVTLSEWFSSRGLDRERESKRRGTNSSEEAKGLKLLIMNEWVSGDGNEKERTCPAVAVYEGRGKKEAKSVWKDKEEEVEVYVGPSLEVKAFV